MRRFLFHTLFALAMFSVSACYFKPMDTIAEHRLQGQIASEPWTMSHGRAEPFGTDGEYWFEMWSADVDVDCGSNPPPSNSIHFARVLSVSDSKLSQGSPATFTFGNNENEPAHTGRLIIEKISDDKVYGQLLAESGENIVNGTFEVTICR